MHGFLTHDYHIDPTDPASNAHPYESSIHSLINLSYTILHRDETCMAYLTLMLHTQLWTITHTSVHQSYPVQAVTAHLTGVHSQLVVVGTVLACQLRWVVAWAWSRHPWVRRVLLLLLHFLLSSSHPLNVIYLTQLLKWRLEDLALPYLNTQ